MSFLSNWFKSNEQKEQENKERWEQYYQEKVEKFKSKLEKFSSNVLKIFIDKAEYEFCILCAEKEFTEYDERKIDMWDGYENIVSNGIREMMIRKEKWKIERRQLGLKLLIDTAKKIL